MCDGHLHASGYQVFEQTRVTQHQFEVAMDQCLENLGITYAQYRALEVLFGANEMHVSELARRLRLTRQATTNLVDKLGRVGYVDTIREPSARYLRISPEARQQIELVRSFADLPGELEKALTPAERGTLVELLRRSARAAQAPWRRYWWLDPEVPEPVA